MMSKKKQQKKLNESHKERKDQETVSEEHKSRNVHQNDGIETEPN